MILKLIDGIWHQALFVPVEQPIEEILSKNVRVLEHGIDVHYYYKKLLIRFTIPHGEAVIFEHEISECLIMNDTELRKTPYPIIRLVEPDDKCIWLSGPCRPWEFSLRMIQKHSFYVKSDEPIHVISLNRNGHYRMIIGLPKLETKALPHCFFNTRPFEILVQEHDGLSSYQTYNDPMKFVLDTPFDINIYVGQFVNKTSYTLNPYLRNCNWKFHSTVRVKGPVIFNKFTELHSKEHMDSILERYSI